MRKRGAIIGASPYPDGRAVDVPATPFPHLNGRETFLADIVARAQRAFGDAWVASALQGA